MRLILAVIALFVLAAPGVALARQDIPPTIVYFEPDSDELTPTARGQLDELAQLVRAARADQLIVAGHADAAEGEGASDQVLYAQLRAGHVRQYLVARGVPEGWITTQAFGTARPAVDGKAEPANRRVEITVGPPSGW